MTIQQTIDYAALKYKTSVRCYHDAIKTGFYKAAEVYRQDFEALEMALVALREKAERENTRPLTLEELEKMTGEPVYVVSQKRSRWCIVHSFHMENVVGRCFILTNVSSAKEHFPRSEYGITWKAYRHKPKEV